MTNDLKDHLSKLVSELVNSDANHVVVKRKYEPKPIDINNSIYRFMLDEFLVKANNFCGKLTDIYTSYVNHTTSNHSELSVLSKHEFKNYLSSIGINPTSNKTITYKVAYFDLKVKFLIESSDSKYILSLETEIERLKKKISELEAENARLCRLSDSFIPQNKFVVNLMM